MNTTNTITKLLKILILALGLVCAILVFGVLTRDNPNAVHLVEELTAKVDELSRTVNTLSSSNDSLTQNVAELQVKNEALTEMNYELTLKLQELNKQLEVGSLSDVERYVNYAYNIADEYYPDIKPEYVCAIMYHESRFDPTQTNTETGVKGLCQISPKWHTKRANNLGVEDLYDPYGNILVCFDILNELSQSGNFSYALNFYAGGYPYATRYLNETSPFEKELEQIMDEQNFAQYVLPYSII